MAYYGTLLAYSKKITLATRYESIIMSLFSRNIHLAVAFMALLFICPMASISAKDAFDNPKNSMYEKIINLPRRQKMALGAGLTLLVVCGGLRFFNKAVLDKAVLDKTVLNSDIPSSPTPKKPSESHNVPDNAWKRKDGKPSYFVKACGIGMPEILHKKIYYTEYDIKTEFDFKEACENSWLKYYGRQYYYDANGAKKYEIAFNHTTSKLMRWDERIEGKPDQKMYVLDIKDSYELDKHSPDRGICVEFKRYEKIR